MLDIGVLLLSALGFRIGCPDQESETLDEGSIIRSMDADDGVAGWDAEVLPSHVLVARHLVPELVHDEGACFVDYA